MITQRACFVPLDHAVSGVVPLSQPQISKLLKTTCPVQCGPRVLVHFLRRQYFLDRAVAKHFDYSQKRKNSPKIQPTRGIRSPWRARPQPRTVQLQDVPFVTTGRCRSADLAVAGVVAEQGPCKPTPTKATKPKRRSPLFLSLIRRSARCPLAFRSW